MLSLLVRAAALMAVVKFYSRAKNASEGKAAVAPRTNGALLVAQTAAEVVNMAVTSVGRRVIEEPERRVMLQKERILDRLFQYCGRV